MGEENPPQARYPDLPWSSVGKETFVPLRAEDLSSRAQVEDLILRMFDQPETSFYLYLADGQFLPVAMRYSEERHEIQMPLVKRPFYLHKAGGDHSFSEIKEASPNGVEYKQVTLRLTEKKRRELTIEQHLQAGEAKRPPEPVLYVKPSFLGVSIDLKALWKRITK